MILEIVGGFLLLLGILGSVFSGSQIFTVLIPNATWIANNTSPLIIAGSLVLILGYTKNWILSIVGTIAIYVFLIIMGVVHI